jgi:hypothetical protein
MMREHLLLSVGEQGRRKLRLEDEGNNASRKDSNLPRELDVCTKLGRVV